MVFSSSVFLFLFLPIVLAVYFLLPGLRVKNVFLVLASLIFYAWGELFFVLIMLVSIACNYGFGLVVDRLRENRKAARRAVAAAIVVNLGLLAFYKYANFFVDNLNVLLNAVGAVEIKLSPVHLPIGISFFTFHAISYIVDIYRRDANVQKNPLNVGLYISLFPQLVAGPIVRYGHVSQQITDRRVLFPDFVAGTERFVIGLGKKMIFANTFGAVADDIFGSPAQQLPFGPAWIGLISYTLQIFFDFSGYSDMALGLGRMFGFHFRENFDYPYISGSIREFWRRWHISLSSWFRDYLYIPLGGSRISASRTRLNLLVVFFLCGLWHGAKWNFVLWGLFHGFFLALERTRWSRILERLPAPVRHAYAMLVVSFGWVLFRSTSLSDATHYFAALLGLSHGAGIEIDYTLFHNAWFIVLLAMAVPASTPIIPWLSTRWSTTRSSLRPGFAAVFQFVMSAASVLWMGLIMVVCAMFLANGTYNPFIYFRF
jgi:alginate O-acetyltransferase complex protein AlgI